MTSPKSRAWLSLTVLACIGCASSIRDGVGIDRIAASAAALRSESEAQDAEAERVADLVSMALEAAAAAPESIEELLRASEAAVWLADRTDERILTLPAERRSRWAAVAVDSAVLCRQRKAEDPRCAYRLAIALGVQARERRTTGLDALPRMVDLLRWVERSAPELDRAGARRVLAWVHLRAPAWPTGPGDPELALEYAEGAVSLEPDYPPNRLVLAAVLAELGESERAIREYETARRTAASYGAEPSSDRDRKDWGEEALRGLAALGVADQ